MIWEILIAFCLVCGGFFALVGSYGLLKLDNPMSRLHAPTKASTLGVGSVLGASMIHSFMVGEGTLHEVMIMAFLFVTAPITAQFISKVHIHRSLNKDEIAPPAEGQRWAVLADDDRKHDELEPTD